MRRTSSQSLRSIASCSSQMSSFQRWPCLTAIELLVMFGAMRSMPSWDWGCGGFAVWLLLTTLICLNPDEAGPHLYGAHEETSGRHPTTAGAFDSSVIITTAPGQGCDDEVLAIVPAKSLQDSATPPQAVGPDVMGDVAPAGSRRTARIVRGADSPPGDLGRLIPLRI